MEEMNQADQTLETIAYTEIYNAIITGIFPPGYQIVEEGISEQLNMSRSPVRSAIKRLQAEGFLEKRTNRRIYVTFPSTSKVVDALYVREALDGMTARLAAIKRTDEDIAEIETILEQSNESLSQNDLFRQHELAVLIHIKIYNASHNEMLSRMAANIEHQTALFTYRSLQDDVYRAKCALDEHTLICRHVIDQKPDEAESAAREHINKLLQRVLIVEQRQKNLFSGQGHSSLRIL